MDDVYVLATKFGPSLQEQNGRLQFQMCIQLHLRGRERTTCSVLTNATEKAVGGAVVQVFGVLH